MPVNLKELQSFLGLAGYYRKFILGFSSIAEPLYTLCRKNIPFSWQQEQQAAFEELKDRLVSAPILAYPDFSPMAGSFILDTDESQYLGIGAVLLHHSFGNACFTYVDYSRYYSLSWKFCSQTDHNSLRWLTSYKEPQGQVPLWLERLQEYDFEIQHRPGKHHSNAGSLS